MAHAHKPDFVFDRNERIDLNRRGQRSVQSSTGSREMRIKNSDCIIFRLYVDQSLKMSLQVKKKGVQRSGDREIVCNVYKLMKTESELDITICGGYHNLKWVSQSEVGITI